MAPSPFMQSLAEFMAVRRYSKRTVEAYLYWIRYFIRFHQLKHPSELGAEAVEQFLTHLAVQRTVAASTQALALNALVFLYNTFLQQPLGDVSAFRRSSRQQKLPVVLTTNEIKCLLDTLTGVPLLMASLMYGSGLRRIELVRLRVRDIDANLLQVRIWNGKGARHRIVTLAPELVPDLHRQIFSVKLLLEQDLSVRDYAGVWMPGCAGAQVSIRSDIVAVAIPVPRLEIELRIRHALAAKTSFRRIGAE